MSPSLSTSTNQISSTPRSIYCIIDFHLMKRSDSRLLQSFLGFKLQMVVPWWLPDLFREVRFLFTAPTTCPWGAIGLFLIVLCCCSCLAGICIGAFAFSVQCRKFASGLVRLAFVLFHQSLQISVALEIAWLSTGDPVDANQVNSQPRGGIHHSAIGRA